MAKSPIAATDAGTRLSALSALPRPLRPTTFWRLRGEPLTLSQYAGKAEFRGPRRAIARPTSRVQRRFPGQPLRKEVPVALRTIADVVRYIDELVATQLAVPATTTRNAMGETKAPLSAA